MKKMDMYTILSNRKINDNDIYELVLEGDTSAIKNPGEFVEIKVPGTFLPRPFSIAEYTSDCIFIVYKVVGDGTKILSEMGTDQELEVLTGLGNGFDLSVNAEKPLLVGGGTGAAPMYNLALSFLKRGIVPTVVLGFKEPKDVFYYETFENAGITPYVVIENEVPGKTGGLVTDVIPQLDYDYFYACGPKGMLKAVSDIAVTDGEVSLESRMACGIGQCKCCSIETNDGMKTLCKDGPVLKKGLVRW